MSGSDAKDADFYFTDHLKRMINWFLLINGQWPWKSPKLKTVLIKKSQTRESLIENRISKKKNPKICQRHPWQFNEIRFSISRQLPRFFADAKCSQPSKKHGNRFSFCFLYAIRSWLTTPLEGVLSWRIFDLVSEILISNEFHYGTRRWKSCSEGKRIKKKDPKHVII